MAAKEETTAPPAVNDAYTGMLGISLFALVVAGVLLYLDYSQYPDSKGPAVPKAPPIATASPAEVQAPPQKADAQPKAEAKAEQAPNADAPKVDAPEEKK